MLGSLTRQYDDTEYTSDLPSINPNLTAREYADAIKWRDKTGGRGLMLMFGMPGQGKGLVANMVAKKLNLYLGKKVLRDDIPKRLFGPYTLFNEDVLLDELERMSMIARGEAVKKTMRSKNSITNAQNQISQWRTEKGDVLLKGSVLLLDEFWRYMHNRRPHNPMGILLGGIIKMWRHLDLMIIGIAQQKHELDQFSCLPYVTHEVRCEWVGRNTARYKVYPVRYVGSRGVFEAIGESWGGLIDGNKPREWLNGGRLYDLYNSKSAVNMLPKLRKREADEDV